jgi:carbamoyl-phosphate synthase large subunit
MTTILLTGGGGAGNESLWKMLGAHYTLHFGDADPLAIDPSIPKGRQHQLPLASDPDFVEKIASLCERLKVDLLIPGVDEELAPLARNAMALAPMRLLLPDVDYVETMLDKLRMIRALSDKQIPVPRSRTLADDLDGLRFPCIAKPRSGRGSRDVRVLNAITEVIGLRSMLGDAAVKTLLQDKIEGVEYTVQMAADALGRLCAVVPVKVGVKRGITIRAETDAEPRVIAACQAIHEAIPAAGCYNIQLMLTPEGTVLPFEINPRISTTLCLVAAAGIDPIAIFLGRACNDDILPFVEGIRLRRHWINHFSKDIGI